MKKIIDCFLFFQELDLLEIRLKYLDPYVDVFVIVEACQVFSGAEKSFVFEDNKYRFSAFLSKIVYYKVTDMHANYDSVISHLIETDSRVGDKVMKIMTDFIHFPKEDLHWVLDSYHRECIHFPLDEIANDGDVIFLSDLDEIPSKKLFEKDLYSLTNLGPLVCEQKEFSYFLNYYRIDSKWRGSIFGLEGVMATGSLNRLRMDSRVLKVITGVIADGGYHFTSVGSIRDIRHKIESWGHQEFNNSKVKDNLDQKIITGQDPFGRQVGTIFHKVDPSDSDFFDSTMSSLIKSFPSLIASEDIKVVSAGLLLRSVHKVNWFGRRALYKLFKFFGAL